LEYEQQPKPASHPAGKNHSGPSRWKTLLLPVILLVLVTALYTPSMRNDFIYDDHELILDQQRPHCLTDVLRVFGERHWYNLPYYRPVARLTMVAQKFFHNDNPAGFHLFNAVVMAIGAGLAYGLLRLDVFNIRPVAAFLAAAIFAAHPIASSCVYPVCSGRETLIPAVFTLAALYCFLRAGKSWYALAVGSFALALLSKEQAIVIPAVFVLADVLGLTRNPPGSNIRRWLQRYFPILLVIAAYLAVRLLLFGGKAEHQLAVFQRPFGPLLTLLYTIQTIFAPPVQLVYEPRPQIWFSGLRLLAGSAATVLVGIAARRHWPKVKKQVLFWLGLALLSLAPTANFLVQETSFAERYCLLALLAAVAIAAALGSLDWQKPLTRRLIIAIGIISVVGSAAISLHRCRYFADDFAFLNQWIKTDPASPQAYASLAEVFHDRQDYDQAINYYNKAVQVSPNDAPVYVGLGVALAKKGNLEQAMKHFEKALQLDPNNPKTYNDMGLAYQTSGYSDKAVEYFYKALQLDSENPEFHYNLAVTLQSKADLDNAATHYQKAIQLNRRYLEAINNLANTLQQQGKTDEAITCYQKALKLNPDFPQAHYNLALTLRSQGKIDEAIAHFRSALQIDPTYARAHASLAAALQSQGKTDEAAAQLAKLAELQPEDADLHYKLALLLTTAGRVQDGVEHFRQAIKLKPDQPAPVNALAWILATNTDLAQAERTDAVWFAEKACELTKYEDPSALDTLAAAYASQGRFEKAIGTAQKAIELATAAGAEKTASQIKQRLELYEEGQPYREPAPR